METSFCRLLLHRPHNNGCYTNIKTLYGVNTMTLNGEITKEKITNGEITSGGKSEGYRLFAKPLSSNFARFLRMGSFSSRSFGYRQQRFLCKRQGVKTVHFVARTFFAALLVSRTFTFTRIRVWLNISQELCCLFFRTEKSTTQNMFHRPFLDVLGPFPSFLCHAISCYIDSTAHHWNQEETRCPNESTSLDEVLFFS